MKRCLLVSVLLLGCASSAVPPEEPSCAPELLSPDGSDHLVSISSYVGFAGRYRPTVVIHEDGRVTTAGYDGTVVELPSLGEARVAELTTQLRETGALGEIEGCYEGSSAPSGPDSGCGTKVTLELDGVVARFSGCAVPGSVRDAYDVAYAYETEARALED